MARPRTPRSPWPSQGGSRSLRSAREATTPAAARRVARRIVWGLNASGQLGSGATTNSLTPVAVLGSLTFAAVGAGGNHTCGRTTGGVTYCWGDDSFGQLGDGSTTNSPNPVAVSGGVVFAGASEGDGHTCAHTTSGTAYCWGLTRSASSATDQRPVARFPQKCRASRKGRDSARSVALWLGCS